MGGGFFLLGVCPWTSEGVLLKRPSPKEETEEFLESVDSDRSIPLKCLVKLEGSCEVFMEGLPTEEWLSSSVTSDEDAESFLLSST